MLDVVILEPDPIIALDLEEAVRAADPRARIEVVDTVEQAWSLCARGRPPTHGFVRTLSQEEQEETRSLVAALALAGASVVLLGAETLPKGTAPSGRVSCLPFPFSAGQVQQLLGATPPRPTAA
jgi:hypothetical protein